MDKDDNQKYSPSENMISYILMGMTTGEIVAKTGSSHSNIKQQYDRVISRVIDEIALGYDARRDSNKSKAFIRLREEIRNKIIEEGFKNNLLYSVESMKNTMRLMQVEEGGIVEKAKIIEKMHKQILEIQKISIKGKR